jgi:tripartite ATP-independent transporter DctP family solute receptor
MTCKITKRTLIKGAAVGGAALAFGCPSLVKAADPIKIRIAYANNVGEPNDLAVREWGRLAKEKSGGRVEFQYFPSSQLGSQKDVTEQLTMGANTITISDGGFLMDYVPEMALTYMPYLYDNKEQLFRLIDSDLFKGLSKRLEDKGLFIVHAKWIYGIRHMLVNKPATKPEDFKGVKIRAPNIRISTEMVNAMGGTATPMPLAETYPAIMQKVIDGAENPIPVLYGAKLHEGAKYLILTAHQLNLSMWVCGTGFMKKLPPDLIPILKSTGEEAGRFLDKENEKADIDALEKMKATGVKVIEPDRAAFKKVMADFPSRFRKEIPEETMKQVMAILQQK